MKIKIILLIIICFGNSLWGMEQLRDLGDMVGLNEQVLRFGQEIGREAAQHRQNMYESLRDERLNLERKREQLRNNRSGMNSGVLAEELAHLNEQERALHAREENENRWEQNVGSVATDVFKQGAGLIFSHARHQDDLETAVATTSVKEEASQKGAMDRAKLFLEKNNLARISVFLVLTAAGVFGSYYALTYAYRYFEAKMGMPTLIRDSSRFGWKDALLKYFGKKNRRDENAFRDVVLAPQIAEQVFSLAVATALTHEKGLQYRHLLLYGPPGTGKTLVARTLAHSSGMDYAIISGADFSQFKPGVDVQKLHEVFDWADKGTRGLILFIDEADALLRDRKQLDERSVKLVDAFLSRTNASSDKFMIVLATNYPENLDSAVLSRINKKVSIPLPTRDERILLLKLYTSKYLLNNSAEAQNNDKQEQKQNTKHKELVLTVAPEINDAYLTSLADQLDGFAGRDIDQLLGEIRIEGCMTENNTVTKDLFDRIVMHKIEQYEQERAWANKVKINSPSMPSLSPCVGA